MKPDPRQFCVVWFESVGWLVVNELGECGWHGGSEGASRIAYVRDKKIWETELERTADTDAGRFYRYEPALVETAFCGPDYPVKKADPLS